MAPENRHESIAPEYRLADSGQLALHVGRPEWPPARRSRPVEDPRVAAKSQTRLDVERELYGHQLELPSFKNVIVDAVREHEDRTFFEQPAPRMPEPAVPAEDVELAPPAETATVIEFPVPTAKAA